MKFNFNLSLFINNRNFSSSFKKDYLNYELKQRLNIIKEEEINEKKELFKIYKINLIEIIYLINQMKKLIKKK